MPFHGTFDHTLDAKNRLTVPSRFRAALSGTVVLAKGFETCLAVYPEPEYTKLTEAALAGLNPFSPQARDLKRHFYANALTTELDGAGRIMIPGPFLDHAGMGREAVITGAGDCLEIWDRATWQQIHPGLATKANEHIASIGS